MPTLAKITPRIKDPRIFIPTVDHGVKLFLAAAVVIKYLVIAPKTAPSPTSLEE